MGIKKPSKGWVFYLSYKDLFDAFDLFELQAVSMK